MTEEGEKTYFWGQQQLKIKLTENASAPAMSLVGRSVLELPAEAEGGSYGSALVRSLVSHDIANSPFIDWERGTCSFDSELFLRLLKVAKKYAYNA